MWLHVHAPLTEILRYDQISPNLNPRVSPNLIEIKHTHLVLNKNLIFFISNSLFLYRRTNDANIFLNKHENF